MRNEIRPDISASVEFLRHSFRASSHRFAMSLRRSCADRRTCADTVRFCKYMTQSFGICLFLRKTHAFSPPDAYYHTTKAGPSYRNFSFFSKFFSEPSDGYFFVVFHRLARGMRKKIKKIKNSSFSGSTLFLALLFIYFSFATFLFVVFSFVSFLCGNVIFLLRALWE